MQGHLSLALPLVFAMYCCVTYPKNLIDNSVSISAGKFSKALVSCLRHFSIETLIFSIARRLKMSIDIGLQKTCTLTALTD